jgi:hypothetical protein
MVGSHAVVVGVTDTQHPGSPTTCQFSVTVLNTAPVITCCDLGVVGVNTTACCINTATDANVGDVLTFELLDDNGVVGPVTLDPNSGEICFTPDMADGDQSFCFVIRVVDCAGAADTCCVPVDVITQFPFGIVIEKVHGQLQGHHGYVNVTKTTGSENMLGFDFLIGYDASALAFVGAIAGPLFDIPGMYEWEYFTYRYNWNGNCGNGCPTGLLRVVGMADQNDGPHHPLDVMVPDGMVLFTLDFLVSSDYNLGGQFVPIYFYWMDCGDNTIAVNFRSDPVTDIKTAMSEHVYIYNGDPYLEVTDMFWGFPTITGAQWECFQNPLPDKPIPVPFIWFFGGGIDIIPPEEIDERGDVNLNGVANEIADAVVFTNYFIYGYAAFVINFEGQKAATEINGDGIALTVADLVYLIRVIVGDAMPLPKVAPNIKAGLRAHDGVINVDAELGAAHFVFEGDVSVSLAEGAAGMEIGSHFDGVNTNVIMYSFIKGMTASGNILHADGNVVAFEAADYNGNTYKTSVLPSDYFLTSYPNPFNPDANIELSLPVASDWSISIYNVAGQLVKNFSGHSEAGRVTVTWNASAQASGIYFFKAQAGEFSATQKMVLLK